MEHPVRVCGRLFTPQLLEQLQRMNAGQPPPSRNALAREICRALNWCTPDGRLALPGAKVALRKLAKRGLLSLPGSRARKSSHKLRGSGQPLPPLQPVPDRVQQVRGLALYLLRGHEDPHHRLWNDLIIQQHPCQDAPLVGAQLRYLIGSEHGWLGALGFGPAAFALGARDQWIGWSSAARLAHLPEVLGLSRVLIRREVRCANLLSKVLSLALKRVGTDWHGRYGVKPVLVETFVERDRYTGQSLRASNWRRLGRSTGRGRLGPAEPTKSLKDIWVYPLADKARQQLQEQPAGILYPKPLLESLAGGDWCGQELAQLQLGDERLHRRAEQILQSRWEQPQASFYGTFTEWSAAKGAYRLLESERPDISLGSLLAPHVEATQARMAAEPTVLLIGDTTSFNYSGLKETTGLGSLGENEGQGLWSHNVLACRTDGLPLGLFWNHTWARPPDYSSAGRNARSLDEKESRRWVEAFHQAGLAARRMPQTQLVNIADREGDIYELYDAGTVAPANLHTLIRAQHDRHLASHQKLWACLEGQPVGALREVAVPRRLKQPARQAQVEVRWARVTIEAPAVGPKKGWPSLRLWAVWVREINAPVGVEPIEWMLLTDLPIATAEQAWEKVQWYCRRWTIEEWHRVLKSGCQVEQREFKSAETLQRALAFDLIVAWRVLALVKLGRAVPQLPADIIYAPEERELLVRYFKKNETTNGPLAN
jgi:hypothetical protein